MSSLSLRPGREVLTRTDYVQLGHCGKGIADWGEIKMMGRAEAGRACESSALYQAGLPMRRAWRLVSAGVSSVHTLVPRVYSELVLTSPCDANNRTLGFAYSRPGALLPWSRNSRLATGYEPGDCCVLLLPSIIGQRAPARSTLDWYQLLSSASSV